MLDGNESTILPEKEQILFKNLIIEVAKVDGNIRYCTNINCLCWPETQISRILEESSELATFLKKVKIHKHIEKLLATSDKKKTVFDIYGDF